MSIVINGYIVKLNVPRCLEDPCMYTGNDQHKSVKLSTVCRNGLYLLLLLNYCLGENKIRFMFI